MELLGRVTAALQDRYQVERVLGHGGTAVVFLARDLKHGRFVAIKVLRPDLAAAVGAERFLREIEISATLNHPNILPLHDSGEADGLLYYVMPYVEGESLRARLDRRGALPLDEAMTITAEVCDALAYAHAQDLIHRDIKPENILFQAGHAVVSDFGIARAIHKAAGARLTDTGLAVGTVAYMSPEQAMGDEELDERTDVYATACVLFEALTGAAPHAGTSARAAMARKVMEAPPRPVGAREPIPAPVEEVLLRALAPKPDDRYATASALSTELRRATTVEAAVRVAGRRRAARFRRFTALVGLAAALGWGGWWVRQRLETPRIQRIAVLPLTNLTNDPEQQYLVAGIHDALISELQKVGAVIIGRTSVMRYQEGTTPVRDIARQLHVDGVLEGSVIRAGDSIGVQVRLVDGRTEAQVWSGTFDGGVRNVLAMYREITGSIADQMRLALSPSAEARLAEKPTVDPQVYEAVLQGNFYRAKATPEALETAQQYYERAIALDSTNAAAFAGLASVYAFRAQMGLAALDSMMEIARPLAERAFALDDQDANVHFMLATTMTWGEWDWAEAEREYVRTLELDPSMAQGHGYFSHYLYTVGDRERARIEIQRALDADPLDPLVQDLYAMTLMYEHRFDDAVSVLEAVRRNFPEDPIALSTLRSAYHMAGRYEDAFDAWKASYANLGNEDGVAALERGWEAGGYAGALRAAAASLLERGKTTYVTPWQIGTLYVRAGDPAVALDYLEKAFAARDPNCPYLAVDPIFDAMRDEPRFQALIDGLGLPERS
ncbi:MAG: protein kinase [Gemmatimonadota bacterium]|jgi:serine/threonine-protein kinase